MITKREIRNKEKQAWIGVWQAHKDTDVSVDVYCERRKRKRSKFKIRVDATLENGDKK